MWITIGSEQSDIIEMDTEAVEEMRAEDAKDTWQDQLICRHRSVREAIEDDERIEEDTDKRKIEYKRQNNIADSDLRFICIAVIENVTDDSEEYQYREKSPF